MATRIFSRAFHLLGIDRDIGFALSSRLVAATGQLVTLVLVAALMPAPLQGYHFTFISFAAFQYLFELGLYVVIVNLAAHESARLDSATQGTLSGPERSLDRLATLLKFSLRWYAVVSILFFTAVTVGGWVFFSASPSSDAEVAWHLPWIGFVAATGLQIWSNFALYFIEGCGRVTDSYRIRLWATTAGQIAGWIMLLASAWLWVAASAFAVTALGQLAMVARRHRALFSGLLARKEISEISWKQEVWPLQWRIALQGLTGFLFMSMMVPATHYFYGATAAGRVGLTWALASGALGVMGGWLQARAPKVAAHIARRETSARDALFFRSMWASGGTLAVGLCTAFVAIEAARAAELEIAGKFLPAIDVAVLFAAVTLLQMSAAMSMYFRAYKTDPSTFVNVFAALAGTGAIFWAGARVDVSAMIWAYFLTIAVLLLPLQTLIFRRFRSSRAIER